MAAPSPVQFRAKARPFSYADLMHSGPGWSNFSAHGIGVDMLDAGC